MRAGTIAPARGGAAGATSEQDLVPGRGPVLLVGGAATTAPLLGPMARRLSGAGYDVTPVAIGAGLDCASRTVDTLARRVCEVSDDAGSPVQLVGHSRGGQFARSVAGRLPERIGGLVTLGTPFDLYGLRLPTLFAVATLTAAGTVGVPGMVRTSCMVGSCCREYRRGLRRPLPEDMPFTCVHGRADRVVPRWASTDPGARNVEVSTGHMGLLTDHEAHRAASEALAAAPVAGAQARGQHACGR